MHPNEKFLKIEAKYLNDAKYFEGINLNKDPGEHFVVELIRTSAAEIRKKWEESKCQHCSFWLSCGHKLKKECNDYKEEMPL